MYLFTGWGVRLEPRKAGSLSESVRELPLYTLEKQNGS